MKQNLIYIICSIIIITITIIGVFIIRVQKKAKINIDELIIKITQDTKLIDINTDHNQALDVIEYAHKKGLQTPKILVNFDTHSDIFLNSRVIKPEGAGLENWINEYIAKNPQVEVIYWVMPKEEATDYELRTFFGENKEDDLNGGVQLFGNSIKNSIRGRFAVIPLTQKSYSQKFLIDSKTGILNEYDPTYRISTKLFDPNIQYRSVKIITCTEQTLPNLAGQNVFLSIDADYTSNSGFDTIGDFKIIKSPKEVENTFISIFETLSKKNIKPAIISLSISPQYLPEAHHELVYNIYNYFLHTSGKHDEIKTYTRTHPQELDMLKNEYNQ